MERRLVTTILLLSLLAGATAAAASPGDLQGALRAAFGPGPRHVLQPAHPPGAAKGDNYGVARVELTFHPAVRSQRPGVLVPLGGERYGLVALETDLMGAHGSPGAVAVAYLRRGRTGWRLERAWPEFIWSGNNGNPADVIRVLTFAEAPLVVLDSDYVGQGQHTDTAWIIRLRGDRPEFLGRIPTGGSLESEECSDCWRYEYRGVIGPPRKRGDVLSVTYSGRVQMDDGRWRRLSQWTDYRSRDGELVPTRHVALPLP